MFHSGNLGFLRLYCTLLPDGHQNHWDTPNLFLQKFPAPAFTATTKVDFRGQMEGDQTGLIVMGEDYAGLVLEKSGDKIFLSQLSCPDAESGSPEEVHERVEAPPGSIYLRVEVSERAAGEGAICSFEYSADGKRYKKLGETFTATPGRWIGAKVGLFATGREKTNDSGYADYDWFRIE